jgi:hypothetical protein
MHRSCLAEPPLEQLRPFEISSLLNPTISFISVPSFELRISGPYKTLLEPLLKSQGICGGECGRTIIPCLSRQLPAIEKHFPSIHIVAVDKIKSNAQASLRTVTLPPEIGFPYHIKFALACKVSSALRTVSPWTACVGPELSNVLQDLLPESLWICREFASVTGAQDNFDEAKHITSIIREDIEPRAERCGQSLVVAAALTEQPVGIQKCYAEFLFDLDNEEKKISWLKE